MDAGVGKTFQKVIETTRQKCTKLFLGFWLKSLKNKKCIMPAKLVVVEAHIRMCPRFFIVVLSIVLICMKRKFYKGKQVGEHQSQLSSFIIDNWMNL